MEKEKEDKAVKPASDKLVKIQINDGRVIMGLGQAGEVFEVSVLVANNFVAQGLATILKEEN